MRYVSALPKQGPDTMTSLRDLIQETLNCGLAVVEIISEPDGTIRVLTKPIEETVTIDPLLEARAKRAAKDKKARSKQQEKPAAEEIEAAGDTIAGNEGGA